MKCSNESVQKWNNGLAERLHNVENAESDWRLAVNEQLCVLRSHQSVRPIHVRKLFNLYLI